MEIAEYLNFGETVKMNNIPFRLCWVNIEDHADIDTPMPFEGANGTENLTFVERLFRAKKELKAFTAGMTTSSAITEFRNQTDDGNNNYWGNYCFVYVRNNSDDVIRYGVRMD